MAEVAAIITGIGVIVGGIVYLVKTGVWAFSKTPEQKDADIDAQEEKNKEDAQNSGRPV